MNLPKAFIEEIQLILGDETPVFLKSLEGEKRSGLRINTLKVSVEDFLKISPFELEPIPWTSDGFYYKNEDRPAKHPYYHCGLYYIQEPSAMSPVEVMLVEAKDRVLDLCAAPGGKTIQIASKLGNTGLIVTNDISTGRVKALVKNVELFGIKNAIVLNEDHHKISAQLKDEFTKVLIDAPCSGEGMFRKDQNAVDAWGSHGVQRCRDIQDSIMDEILDVLIEGGELVYSTCTFNRRENEMLIDSVINAHENMSCLPIDAKFGFVDGVDLNGDGVLSRTKRIFPHLLKGEGHFIAKLKKEGQLSYDNKEVSTKPPKAFEDFQRLNLNVTLQGHFQLIKDKLYLLPENNINTKGLRVARSGWLLGEIKRDRFKPAQSMAMGLDVSQVKRVIDIKTDDINAIKYLKGETINLEGDKGLNLITIDGFPVGWGRLSGRTLKNDYPPGWRYM